jgi:hypothetical protein
MSGPLYAYTETPTHDLELASKQYVDSVAGGGSAPGNATYVTLTTNGTLTDERVLTGTSNQIILTDNGAGSTIVLSTPQDIGTGSTPTFAGINITGILPNLARTFLFMGS